MLSNFNPENRHGEGTNLSFPLNLGTEKEYKWSKHHVHVLQLILTSLYSKTDIEAVSSKTQSHF